MDNEKRIYGESFDIDASRTRELYNKRSERLSQMQNPYTSVLLGDQNPEYAVKWNAIEKETILPLLGVEKTSSVLDLGCGIGRWAETVIPLCGRYTGVDFSEGMVKTAKERCCELMNENTRFICSSVQDYLGGLSADERFDVIIIAGVCMYMNDPDVKQMAEKLLQCASQKCRIYQFEPVALEKRLTLNEIYSAALKSNYSAIYRTTAEYGELFSPLEENGFRKVSSGFMPKLNNEAAYSETDRHYTVFARE